MIEQHSVSLADAQGIVKAPFYGIQESNHGKRNILPGGVPLKNPGKVIGAAGVSGGTGDQEVAEAAAGAAKLS